MNHFEVQNLTAGYGNNTVLENISFETQRGELVGVIGPNGCGKTTLYKAICNSLPHEGGCYIDGIELENLSPRELARLCAYVPQRSGITIDISVLDVVLQGTNPRLKLLEYPSADMIERAIEIIESVGLTGKENMNYMHLSEGQKQLCIYARAIMSGAKLLLLDEPESSLDFRYRYQLLCSLKEWIRTNESGAIITLHDPTLALNFCDRLIVIAEGRIYAELKRNITSLEEMEEKLSSIYGPLSLQKCVNKSGYEQIVMLKEN
ncbi:MAG: ABC transporter ATP-binding protein [Clostridiales bacterium]|nr:ABC transporter ATP-binding protein [Candidatus Crickella merdequi]